MRSRERTALLTCAALAALAASAGPALAAEGGPGLSHPAGRAQSLTWAVVPSPNGGPAKAANFLYGVSCVSASACTAVGIAGSKSLIESWNGTAWSIVPAPGKAVASLSGVSCTSASACTAVGTYGLPAKTLIESWNGTAWKVVPSPNKGVTSGDNNLLGGVSCVSASSCTAVGWYGDRNGRGPEKTLIESWNGTAWKVVPSPSKAHVAVNTLNGVSCASATACTAVGYYGDKTLIESWNGTAWSIVPSPSKGGFPLFYGVSCISPSACTAVGGYFGGTKTLIESWNGTAWSIVPSPNRTPTIGFNDLYGVSCTSATACTAAGFYGVRHTRKTLIELGTSPSAREVKKPR